MSPLLRLLCHVFDMEEINGGQRCPTYMYRWHLISLGPVKFYLHRFVGDDWSLDLHDHPKRFISVGLAGRYIEESAIGLRQYSAPWLRSFPADHRHRIGLVELGEECWTLVIVGPSQREWGFWPDGRFVHWLEFVRGPLGDAARACP